MTDRMILIMVDECGDEVEVERFSIGDELDDDYLMLWEEMKIEKARQRYPEARRFYFEDRRVMERAVNYAVHEFFGDYDPWEDEEEPEDWDDDYGYESNMPCDTYGPCACSSSCPQYYQCHA